MNRKSQNQETGLASGLKTIFLALLISLAFKTLVVHAYVVDGPSMEPTLETGDRIWAASYAYGLVLPTAKRVLVQWDTPEAGEVVIVSSPEEDVTLVKRVVGVGGDVIGVEDGVLTRNGQPLTTGAIGTGTGPDGERVVWREERIGEHTYRTHEDPDGLHYSLPPQEVPDGMVFIVGDHRDRSNDSRSFGPVDLDRVRARAF